MHISFLFEYLLLGEYGLTLAVHLHQKVRLTYHH